MRLQLTFAALLAVHALGAPDPAGTPAPPPMAVEQRISMFRGRTIEVPLRAAGRTPGQQRFLIRTQPRFGKLGEIRITGNRTAVVTYTHDEREGEGTDQFTFAVQSQDSPVSAPGRVSITVSEEPPALSVIHALEFGRTWAGDSHEEAITIRNSGGGLLSGSMTVPPPWKIIGPAEYDLGRRQEKTVRILFTPTAAGKFAGPLVFSHDPRARVALSGEAAVPFVAAPDKEITLAAEPGTAMRSSAFVVRNLTPDERVVDISLPENLFGPEQVLLPPSGGARVALHTAKDFSGSVGGRIELESNGFRLALPVRSIARPPQFSAEPANGIDFGTLSPGETASRPLVLVNSGGTEAQPRAVLPPGLRLVPPAETTVLAPGASREFSVTIDAPPSGGVQGEIAFDAPGSNRLTVPITAKIAAPATPQTPGVSTTTLIPQPAATPDTASPDSGATPVVIAPRVVDASPHSVMLAWRRPAPGTVTYVVERRRIVPQKEAPPDTVWDTIPTVTFQEDGDAVLARLERLADNQSLFLRVAFLDANGKRSAPSAVFHVAVPKRPASPITLWIGVVMAAGLGLAIVAAVLLRRRRNFEAEDAERIARLGSS